MFWMLICIIASAAFGHIMRNAQRCGRNMAWVGTWNYVAAATASWVWWVIEGKPTFPCAAVIYGSIGGLGLAGSYFIMDPCLRLTGVGVTQAVGRLSVILPVVASILMWSEIPDAVQGAGLVLAFAACVLLTYGRAVPHESPLRARLALLLPFFLVQGVSMLTMKAYKQVTPAGLEAAYLVPCFTAAAVSTLLAMFWMKRPDRWDLAHGAALGASNIATNLPLLIALGGWPGIVVFPTTSVGSILLTALLAIVLWRERYRGKAFWGMALAALALVLINLHT